MGLLFAIAREIQPPFVLRPHGDQSGRNTGSAGLRGEWLVLPACLLRRRLPRAAVAEGFCAEVERRLLLRPEDRGSSRLRRILHTGVLPGLGWRNITRWVQRKSIFRHAEGSHHQPV